MKDLKHLIYFESLLEDANNELVRRAEAEGDLAIGYTLFPCAGGAAEPGKLFLGSAPRPAYQLYGAGHLLHGQQQL